MSLSDANLIQENSGSATATTSVNVTLPSGTTAGNTVFVVMVTPGLGESVTAPSSSWVADSASRIYRLPDVAAGATSWTFTLSVSSNMLWYAFEMENVDLVDPVDGALTSSNATIGNGATLASGTTARTAGLSTFALAEFISAKGNTDTVSWDSYTNGFAELIDQSVAGTNLHHAVAWAFIDGITGTYQTTATYSTSNAGTVNTNSRILIYRAADAPLSAPLALFTGFEWGTHAGMGNSSASNPLGTSLGASGTWGTNYLVQSASARSSSYGLRLSPSAATVYVPLGPLTSAAGMAVGLNTRVISGTGTVVVAVLVASPTSLQLVYDTSTNKYGLRWGSGGTPVWQSGTTATSTWVWVDIRARLNSTTWHAEWRIETGTDTYTDQTAVDLTGQSASTTWTSTSPVTLGNSATSQTMTAEYDDVVISRYYAAYPLGPHNVVVSVPETTGASVSGTSTNFSKFTANGTLAAWGSDAGALIDEVPPTISASSDGVVQTAVAASDYMNFPMTNPTLASDEIIAAVRALFAEWGGTGTGTGTIGYRGYDGITETTFVAASASYDPDSLTAASATYPLWKSALWTNTWTPTKLNAAALRIGFSTDATPDMGVSAAYLEVAIRKAQTFRQSTLADPISATADIRVHPYTSASVSYLITNNDATRSVKFNYTGTGTPSSPVTVGPSSTQEVTVTADNFGDIPDVSLEAI